MALDVARLKRSKQLSTSIQDDRKRREVDAAKKRAAAQNVDYPTFAAMVSAAHLKPVDRKSLSFTRTDCSDPCALVPAWGFGPSGNLTAGCEAKGTPAAWVVRDAFQAKWEKLETAADRFQFLCGMPPSELRSSFKVEIPPQVLRLILDTLHQQLVVSREGAARLVSILDSLSKCPRFSISVKLVKPTHSAVLQQLFNWILQCGFADDFQRLKPMYM